MPEYSALSILPRFCSKRHKQRQADAKIKVGQGSTRHAEASSTVNHRNPRVSNFSLISTLDTASLDRVVRSNVHKSPVLLACAGHGWPNGSAATMVRFYFEIVRRAPRRNLRS